MRHITIEPARTWPYKRMRHCGELSSASAALSLYPFWLGCIINMSGYDFRKGHLLRNHRDVLGMRGNRLDPKLRQREIDFLSNVRRSRHAPSGGQEKWLGDIQARIRRAA